MIGDFIMYPMISRFNDSWFPTFSDLFDNDFVAPVRNSVSSPSVNVLVNDKAYKIEVAAPGMTKNDFNVHVEDDNLVITLEKKTDNKEEKKDEKYLRREFSYSKFKQVFTLGEEIDKDKISAKMNDGVLSIDLPKKEPQPVVETKKQIEIL